MKYLICIVALLFFGCGNGDIEGKTSFVNIEDNLLNLESLNKNERAIAEGILATNFNLISSNDLKKSLDSSENLTIIATIPRGIYTLGLINGAKNFEFNNAFSGEWSADTKLAQEKFIEFLGDKNGKIIFYDNGDGSAKVAYQWAEKLDYSNLAYLVGNFSAWRERGFEISFDMPSCCQE